MLIIRKDTFANDKKNPEKQVQRPMSSYGYVT